MPDLLAFVAKYLGMPGTGTNAANKGECVGLIEAWCAANGKPWISGNAVDLLSNADRGAYKVELNGPSNYPSAGAIICWDGSWGQGYGHTAVVLAATPWQVAVFEQNDPFHAPPLVATHSYGGVRGWITFR